MKPLNILYYNWGESTAADCIYAMRKLGHSVTEFSAVIKDYNLDENFVTLLVEKFSKNNYDCIFSFNYFPVISWFCMEKGIKYYSWVYDSPHLTLSSVSLNNSCNEVYIFDKGLCDKYISEGITQVHYLPLGFNKDRLDKITTFNPEKYQHEITFLGNLYNDQYNFYDQIKYIPEDTKKYLEDLIQKQQSDFEHDLFSENISHELCSLLMNYIKFDLGPFYRNYHDDVIKNMFRKKVTVEERYNLLKLLSEKYSVDLYSTKEPENLSVNYLGYANYINQMPLIFNSSKINLNITVRTNISGLPLRIIDILGAKGFLLSSYIPVMEEYFTDGNSIVWFKSPEEMLDKADYYLKHDSQRIDICKKGYEIASLAFTYERLLPVILH